MCIHLQILLYSFRLNRDKYLILKPLEFGVGEMAQQLREHTALEEDQCVAPSTHVGWLTALLSATHTYPQTKDIIFQSNKIKN